MFPSDNLLVISNNILSYSIYPLIGSMDLSLINFKQRCKDAWQTWNTLYLIPSKITYKKAIHFNPGYLFNDSLGFVNSAVIIFNASNLNCQYLEKNLLAVSSPNTNIICLCLVDL